MSDGEVYYNDNDPFVCAWLRNLADAGHLPRGVVDGRSILVVPAGDLVGAAQAHFFAGIGGWPLALRLAGWPDGEPVWTASCPCQPFSSAGRRKGEADERHLWPALYRLIAECRPRTIFGEQVDGSLGLEWLSGIHADLEELGYAFGAASLPAACVGAPHIRQRLFWVAYSDGQGFLGGSRQQQERADGYEPSDSLWLVDSVGAGLEEWSSQRGDNESQHPPAERAGRAVGGLGDAESDGCRQERPIAGGCATGDSVSRRAERPWLGYWSDAVWLLCLDGKARRVKPSVFPLAPRLPGDVGILRGAGNSIVPQAATVFIKAVMDVLGIKSSDPL